MMEVENALLKEVSESTLKELPSIKTAYTKAEGDLAVILQNDKWFRLTNRPFTMIDELLGNEVTKSLEKRLISKNSCVVCDLGGGYLSQAASDILDKYNASNLSVNNIDLFAKEILEKDSRLKIYRGDFRDLSLQKETYDIIYSWQLLEHLNYNETESIKTYQKIVDLLKNSGEAFIDDTKLIKTLESNQQKQEEFKKQTGISVLKFLRNKYQGEDYKSVYILKE